MIVRLEHANTHRHTCMGSLSIISHVCQYFTSPIIVICSTYVQLQRCHVIVTYSFNYKSSHLMIKCAFKSGITTITERNIRHRDKRITGMIFIWLREHLASSNYYYISLIIMLIRNMLIFIPVIFVFVLSLFVLGKFCWSSFTWEKLTPKALFLKDYCNMWIIFS